MLQNCSHVRQRFKLLISIALQLWHTLYIQYLSLRDKHWLIPTNCCLYQYLYPVICNLTQWATNSLHTRMYWHLNKVDDNECLVLFLGIRWCDWQQRVVKRSTLQCRSLHFTTKCATWTACQSFRSCSSWRMSWENYQPLMKRGTGHWRETARETCCRFVRPGGVLCSVLSIRL